MRSRWCRHWVSWWGSLHSSWCWPSPEGFEKTSDKILGSHAHVIVLQYGGHFEGYADAADQVAQLDGVEAAAPFVYTEVMVRSDWGSAGVVLKGIDPCVLHR